MIKTLAFLAILAYTFATVQKANVVLTVGNLSGVITFTQVGKTVKVEGVITGIPEGDHGFHIHQSGDLSKGCASTLGHFNPLGHDHGAPEDENRHVGDLGNIHANSSNIAVVDITDGLICLNGPNSIIGRGVVVHSDKDDLGKGGFADSKTTGHAGARIACGVVSIV